MNQDAKSRYQQYLESDHWRELRKGCFIRDGHRCRACGSGQEINAHHLIYRNLTDCTTEDAMTLCVRCHELIHVHLRNNKIQSGVLSADEVIQVLRLYGRVPVPKAAPMVRPNFRRSNPEPKPAVGWYEKHMAYVEERKSLAIESFPAGFPPEGDGPFIITKQIMDMLRTDAGGYVGIVSDILNGTGPLTKGWTWDMIGKMISKDDLLTCFRNRNTKRGEKPADAA